MPGRRSCQIGKYSSTSLLNALSKVVPRAAPTTDNRGFYEAEEEGPPPHIAPGAYAAYLQAVRA